MKAIYKYTLSPSQDIYIIPSNRILSAIAQEGEIQVYAVVNVDKTEQIEYDYDFRVIGTGHLINENLEEYTFLNTVQLNHLVFHIFYKKLT